MIINSLCKIIIDLCHTFYLIYPFEFAFACWRMSVKGVELEFWCYNLQASSLRVFAGNEDDMIEIGLGGWRGAGGEAVSLYRKWRWDLPPPSFPPSLSAAVTTTQAENTTLLALSQSGLIQNIWVQNTDTKLYRLSYNFVKPCWLHSAHCSAL